MNNETESTTKSNHKYRSYSYRDMLDAWTEGRLNLVKWGVGDGDKPCFASWMRNKFNDSEGSKIQQVK